jgi:hypothetical protein
VRIRASEILAATESDRADEVTAFADFRPSRAVRVLVFEDLVGDET